MWVDVIQIYIYTHVYIYIFIYLLINIGSTRSKKETHIKHKKKRDEHNVFFERQLLPEKDFFRVPALARRVVGLFDVAQE